MSTIGSGLRSKQEIVSLFDELRSQVDSYQDTREKLIKVNTRFLLCQDLTIYLDQPRYHTPLKEAYLSPPPRCERGDWKRPGGRENRTAKVQTD